MGVLLPLPLIRVAALETSDPGPSVQAAVAAATRAVQAAAALRKQRRKRRRKRIDTADLNKIY